MAEQEHPFPPGSYPVVIIGSGPGGLQLSYSLRRLGIEHAVLSADEAPGGMFLKWPLFQRLLSWTKPYAPDGPGSRRFERVDWNSLLAEEPENRALQAKHMDRTSYFPSRAEIDANLADFADRTGIVVLYGCRWESTAQIDDDGSGRFVPAPQMEITAAGLRFSRSASPSRLIRRSPALNTLITTPMSGPPRHMPVSGS